MSITNFRKVWWAKLTYYSQTFTREYSEHCQTSKMQLKTVNYFRKKLHLRCLTRFRIRLCPGCIVEYSCTKKTNSWKCKVEWSIKTKQAKMLRYYLFISDIKYSKRKYCHIHRPKPWNMIMKIMQTRSLRTGNVMFPRHFFEARFHRA